MSNSKNYETAVAAIQGLSVDEIQSMVGELQRVASRKHGVEMPWLIWSRPDFDPGDDYTDEQREGVMDEAWHRALNDHHFTDLTDDDWVVVYRIRDEVLEDMGLSL